jgi:hypothetical protein
MIRGKVTGQVLQLAKNTTVSDSKNYISARFVFSLDWLGLTKTVHFKNGENQADVTLVDDGITQDRGIDLSAGTWDVWLHGAAYNESTGELEERITTTSAKLVVLPYQTTTGEPFRGNNASAVEIEVGKAVVAASKAETARDAAETSANEAATSSKSAASSASSAKETEERIKILENDINGDVKQFLVDYQAAMKELELKRASSLSDIDTAGTVQRNSVMKAGTDAVDSINDSKLLAISSVESAGAIQIKNVNSSGAEQISDINSTGSARLKEVNDAGTSNVNKINTAGSDAVSSVKKAGETQTANITKTGADAVSNIQASESAANTTIEQATSSGMTKIEEAGRTQIDLIKQNGGGVENALSNFFALRRNGKVFTTKIYKYETSTSPVGVKMNANENMVAEPSVGRKEGRDDYAQYGLFHHFTCNFSVDENGFNHVDALEGQIGFTKYGKVQVGEVTMSAWFGIEDTTEAVLYHYSDSQTELTPYPMKESINPDGTISPFMIHAKYAAGDIDGGPYSSKGLAPANGCQATEARNPVSYTGMITYMHKLGGHYCGTTSWDLFYRQLMMIIKYATTHSQSIMAGCTSYSNQNQNLVEETGVMRVVLTKAQAAGYVIGSYVSIGDVGSNTNKDRYFSYIHNKAYSVKVTKIEDVDDSNAAVYVDAPEAFDTTLTTWITTMPWHSGATDEVAGSDGSPNSNTNGKDPYKIQGIETCIGAYEVLGNVVMDIVTGLDGNPARDVYVCEDASTLSSNIATVRANYKKAIAQVAYTAASWKYITEETTDPNLGIMIPTKVGGGSTTGFADGLYTDAGTSGQREWLALGGLNGGAGSGLWILHASGGWSYTGWTVVSGVSPNGTRGEWQATA